MLRCGREPDATRTRGPAAVPPDDAGRHAQTHRAPVVSTPTPGPAVLPEDATPGVRGDAPPDPADSLEARRPSLEAEWDHGCNSGRVPRDVHWLRPLRAAWRCAACGLRFDELVVRRVLGEPCPSPLCADPRGLRRDDRVLRETLRYVLGLAELEPLAPDCRSRIPPPQRPADAELACRERPLAACVRAGRHGAACDVYVVLATADEPPEPDRVRCAALCAAGSIVVRVVGQGAGPLFERDDAPPRYAEVDAECDAEVDPERDGKRDGKRDAKRDMLPLVLRVLGAARELGAFPDADPHPDVCAHVDVDVRARVLRALHTIVP